jgi:uncharacterized repeat protein (TIGR03803 family)
MVEGLNGYFYGTTGAGGSSASCSDYQGCGTVFRIDSSGNESVVYTFTGGSSAGPNSNLVLAFPVSQNYPLTMYGTSVGYQSPGGTVFKLSLN